MFTIHAKDSLFFQAIWLASIKMSTEIFFVAVLLRMRPNETGKEASARICCGRPGHMVAESTPVERDEIQ